MTAAPSLDDVHAARERTAHIVGATPLAALEIDGERYWQKLELLQPIASFKLRGAAATVTAAAPEALASGLLTASAGNMAQGAAWMARSLGLACTVVVPETAPQSKRERIQRLGASIVEVSFDRWWQTFQDRSFPGYERAFFVHPFADPLVMAGNGVIGLELAESAVDVQTVFVPWGGGGLACGIAVAVRALLPSATIYAVEVERAAPLAAAFDDGVVRSIEYEPSFVDGIGSKTVFPDMLDLARHLLDGVVVVSPAEASEAVRLLATELRVVAEGAGAVALAGARRMRRPGSVCIASGGNIDAAKLVKILEGRIP
jgi:threonine dehydratase